MLWRDYSKRKRRTKRDMDDLTGLIEERVVWSKRFQGALFDFRGLIALTRFDCCEFVRCTILIDAATEHLALTGCTFCECNIDQLQSDGSRAVFVRDNVFERPLEDRRLEFEARLAKALSARV